MKTTTGLKRIRKGLIAATGVILSAPVRLPAKVVLVATYVALALGVWESVDKAMKINNIQRSIGTGSGTLLSALAFISTHDVLKTVTLAAIGAVVGFAVTAVLQWWRKKGDEDIVKEARVNALFFMEFNVLIIFGPFIGKLIRYMR